MMVFHIDDCCELCVLLSNKDNFDWASYLKNLTETFRILQLKR